MGQVTLNFNDSMRILNDETTSADARVIAACTVAFLETNAGVDDISRDTRAIALKLSHMMAAQIYGSEPPPSLVDED